MSQEDGTMFILPLSADDFERMLRAAADCYGRGANRQAETILQGLIAVRSDDSRPYKMLGSLLYVEGRHQDAELAYEYAVARDATDLYTLVALAELRLQALKIGEALALLERLFALPCGQNHPARVRARRLLEESCRRFEAVR